MVSPTNDTEVTGNDPTPVSWHPWTAADASDDALRWPEFSRLVAAFVERGLSQSAAEAAADSELWQRYWTRVARFVETRFRESGVSGDDAAASVLRTFVRRGERGDFPDLQD